MRHRLDLPGERRIPIDRLAFPLMAVISVILFFSGVPMKSWTLGAWLAAMAILWIVSRRLRRRRKEADARAALAWAADLLEKRRQQRMRQSPHGRKGVGR